MLGFFVAIPPLPSLLRPGEMGQGCREQAWAERLHRCQPGQSPKRLVEAQASLAIEVRCKHRSAERLQPQPLREQEGPAVVDEEDPVGVLQGEIDGCSLPGAEGPAPVELGHRFGQRALPR